MSTDAFRRERLACAYYFACVGVTYGIFTARMPALKELTSASDGQIGFLLLAFGAASFLGLLSSKYAIERFGSKMIVGVASLVFMGGLTIAALAINYTQVVGFCLLAGLGTGFCDVGMNAQGILIERRHNILCMASLHACYSLGGVAGALSGSACAALNLSPFYNFLIVCGLYALFWPWAFRHTVAETTASNKKEKKKKGLPLIIFFYGVMSMLCYVSEGSVGEWGSVLLHSVKSAPQREAALVFAAFSTAMVICRFLTDHMRARSSDFRIVITGSSLSCAAMAIVLVSPWPSLCIGAYFLMGVGFAPIVPILFSRAGKTPGISVGRATSTISVLSYTGILVFPPFLGMLGDAIGLGRALWVIVGCCFCIMAGSFVLKQNHQ